MPALQKSPAQPVDKPTPSLLVTAMMEDAIATWFWQCLGEIWQDWNLLGIRSLGGSFSGGIVKDLIRTKSQTTFWTSGNSKVRILTQGFKEFSSHVDNKVFSGGGRFGPHCSSHVEGR